VSVHERGYLTAQRETDTQLTATAGTPDDAIPPATAAAMARCGVNLIGFDTSPHSTVACGRWSGGGLPGRPPAAASPGP
jgi:hypothetical protein